MKISEFIGLSFFEASKALKKALGDNRIRWSFDRDAFIKALGLEDAVWGEITQTSNFNSSIKVLDRFTVTQLRIILSFRYNKDIKINYYIGNTNKSCTLKEITYSGIGIYWSNSYPSLVNIGINPDLMYEIPEVYYENGRKGTVQDFLNKKWGLAKVNTDLALVEIDKILTDGSFLKSWNTIEDHKIPKRLISRSRMSGLFCKFLVRVLTDNTKISFDQVVLLTKIECGMFKEYPTAGSIMSSFISESRYAIKKELQAIKPELEKLEREIKRHLDLDIRMSELNDMILAEYDKTLLNYVNMNPDLNLSIDDVKNIIDLNTDVNVAYKYLRVS